MLETECRLRNLTAEVVQLREALSRLGEATESTNHASARSTSPAYTGPTSIGFGLSVVKSSLALVGGKDKLIAQNENARNSKQSMPEVYEDTTILLKLISLGKERLLRLLDVYEQFVGKLYPCLDINSVRKYTLELLDNSKNSTVTDGTDDKFWYLARDFQVLKIVLATALMSEGRGVSQFGAQLAASVEDKIWSRMRVPEVDMKELLILVVLVSCLDSYSPTLRTGRTGSDILCSLSTTSTATTKSLPIEQQDSQQGAVTKWAYTIEAHGLECEEIFRERFNVHGRLIYFGAFTSSIGDGLLAPSCLLFFKTLILMRPCRDLLVQKSLTCEFLC